ncbi:acyl-CoA thioesterase [Anditalea andensis]|uniref:Esterase n=1 Tax=Anditalea andensis TaxID=1048983 RepID=A0A074L1W3_9BACT|nr:thioesterase family protein [Anditalea andensis]KEO75119.1 esterase [Anditalea andensis]
MKKYSVEEVKTLFKFNISIQVKFSDIDGYLHVNNGIYFNYLEHARAIYLSKICDWDIMSTGAVVANLNIDFLRPIHLEDAPQAYVRCIHLGKSSIVLEQIIMGSTANGEEIIFASGTTTMVTVDMKNMRPTHVPETYRVKMQQFDQVNQ